MTIQQFSQALMQERVFIIACQAYRSPETLLRIVESIQSRDQKLCLALPYASLTQDHAHLTDLNVWKGLSDIPSMASHTFTSSVAVRLAKEANVDFVVIGDSTARHVRYETDHSIAMKLRGLLEADIPAVVCFGETAQEYARGSTAEVIKEQLSTLLLGLTFEQMIKTILVYRAPWINTIDPELYAEEHDKAHHLVLDTLKLLFGEDIASHIPLLTDLPSISEDFHKISYDIPPSGYFLELGGLEPHLVSSYFETLHTANFGGPFLPPPAAAHPTEKKTETGTETAEEYEAASADITEHTEPPSKTKKSRKKKDEKPVIVPVEEHEIEDSETVEESTYDTILFMDQEPDTPTIHFELNEPTTVDISPESTESEESTETASEEEFQFEGYKDEELEALRKEFGIQPDGSIELKPYPVWDNTLPVRVIMTQAQKVEAASKPKKSTRKKKNS